MKLRRFSIWSRTRVSRERRHADKGKSTQLSPEKSASSVGSPIKVNTSSEQCAKLSLMPEIVTTEKEQSKLIKGDVAIPSRTHTGVFNMEDARPCFLFEDNEDDNINDSNYSNNKNDKTAEYNPKHQKITKLGIQTPVTPNVDLDTPLMSSPKNLLHPPQEIMIDHLAVPPSPMREPNVNIMASPSMNKRLLDDYHPGMFLNFQESSPREVAPHNHCIGDPVGDIAMQRQLMDAQRLVRIILGKPFNKSEEILGPSSILQAIRSYALTKAELIDLRKKQEIIDGDPPAILLALGSPAATTPSTTRTGVHGGRRSGMQTYINNSGSICGSTGCGSTQSDANFDAPITSPLEHANKTIGRLQTDLATANDTILELKVKMKEDEGGINRRNTSELIHHVEQTEQSVLNDQQLDELVVGEPKQDGTLELQEQIEHDEDRSNCRNTKKLITKNEESQQLMQNDEHHDQSVLEDSKHNGSLDLLLDEIVLIPQRMLTKKVVREKLELYYHNIARHCSENQILEMKMKMRDSQEESDMRILEMENKLKLMDQEHKKQLQAIILEKEHIVDTKTEQKNNTILIELSHNTTGNNNSHLSSSTRKLMVDNVKKSITDEI